jgi:cobaltochelatase CobT
MDPEDAVQVSKKHPVAKPPPYAVFTSAHDLVAPSTDLTDVVDLRKERALLEKRRAEYRRDLGRLVLRLQRRLLAQQMRTWSFDLDDGLVDASRLDRVIVDPGFGSIYKQEEETEFRDAVVSILIDNSGSML